MPRARRSPPASASSRPPSRASPAMGSGAPRWKTSPKRPASRAPRSTCSFATRRRSFGRCRKTSTASRWRGRGGAGEGGAVGRAAARRGRGEELSASSRSPTARRTGASCSTRATACAATWRLPRRCATGHCCRGFFDAPREAGEVDLAAAALTPPRRPICFLRSSLGAEGTGRHGGGVPRPRRGARARLCRRSAAHRYDATAGAVTAASAGGPGRPIGKGSGQGSGAKGQRRRMKGRRLRCVRVAVHVIGEEFHVRLSMFGRPARLPDREAQPARPRPPPGPAKNQGEADAVRPVDL